MRNADLRSPVTGYTVRRGVPATEDARIARRYLYAVEKGSLARPLRREEVAAEECRQNLYHLAPQGYRIPVRSHHVAFGNGGNPLIRVLSARLKGDFNWSIRRLWSLLPVTQIFVGVLEDHLRQVGVTKRNVENSLAPGGNECRCGKARMAAYCRGEYARNGRGPPLGDTEPR